MIEWGEMRNNSSLFFLASITYILSFLNRFCNSNAESHNSETETVFN